MNLEFSKTIEKFLKIIAKTAQTNNVRVFFVGGFVRDNYLNIKTKDIDLIAEVDAIEFSKKLPKEIKIKSIHKDFGTVKLEFMGLCIDLASTRVEKYPFNGCLPKVVKLGVKIEDDVKRRDFTINSLYLEILIKDDELDYRFIDLVGGIDDINSKKLKSLHKKSYLDDATRILRGLDFKYRFGFEFTKTDENLINDAIKNSNLEHASFDRINEVLKKTLESDFQDKIFREIIEKKYYKILSKNEIKIDFEKLEKTILKFDLNKTQKAQLYFDMLKNVSIDVEEFDDEILEYKFYSKMNLVQRANLYYKTQNENIVFYPKIKTLLTGKNLLQMGYFEGKRIGFILDELLRKKIKNPVQFSCEKDEVDWVLKNFPLK